MEVVVLQFQTPNAYAAFRKMVAANVLQASVRELRLVCRCSAAEIANAVNYHKASVITNAKH